MIIFKLFCFSWDSFSPSSHDATSSVLSSYFHFVQFLSQNCSQAESLEFSQAMCSAWQSRSLEFMPSESSSEISEEHVQISNSGGQKVLERKSEAKFYCATPANFCLLLVILISLQVRGMCFLFMVACNKSF